MEASFAAKLRRGSTRTCSAAWSRCAHCQCVCVPSPSTGSGHRKCGNAIGLGRRCTDATRSFSGRLWDRAFCQILYVMLLVPRSRRLRCETPSFFFEALAQRVTHRPPSGSCWWCPPAHNFHARRRQYHARTKLQEFTWSLRPRSSAAFFHASITLPRIDHHHQRQ